MKFLESFNTYILNNLTGQMQLYYKAIALLGIFKITILENKNSKNLKTLPQYPHIICRYDTSNEEFDYERPDRFDLFLDIDHTGEWINVEAGDRDSIEVGSIHDIFKYVTDTLKCFGPDKLNLTRLKDLFIKCQMYEHAARFRDFEKQVGNSIRWDESIDGFTYDPATAKWGFFKKGRPSSHP